MRKFNFLDNIINGVDTALRAVHIPLQRQSRRHSPAEGLVSQPLTDHEKKHVAGLMRVNHSGEVCAQALYQGQAITASLPKVKLQMQQAADEEVDHLAWCEQRLRELNSYPSRLNPIWYLGSFLIGAIAGKIGDQWSLGFVAETERQVSAHLQRHLQEIPIQDIKTHAILATMQADEMHHAEIALTAGAASLPGVIRHLMKNISKLMTKSSYYV